MFENPEEAFGGTIPLLALIETIYGAVHQPELWSVALEKIAEAVNGESTLLFANLPKEPLVSLARLDEAAWNEYATYYSAINPISKRCDEIFPDGVVRYGNQAITDGELIHTEFYNDFFKRNNMHHSFGVKVPLKNLPSAYLSCQRPKSSDPFGEREGLVYETLLPHLQRALTLHIQFTQMQSSVLGLETALDMFEHAVFGLNRDRKVIFSNRQAEVIVTTGDTLRLVNGMLSSIVVKQNQHLQVLLSDAVAVGTGTGISTGDSLLIDRLSGKNPLRVTVTPFPMSLPRSSGQLAALVFVSDPTKRPQSRSAALRALYALTPTEGRIADLLLQGLEVREIMNALSVTLETARFHIKRVLTKTGTRRQTELMRLMLSLPQL